MSDKLYPSNLMVGISATPRRISKPYRQGGSVKFEGNLNDARAAGQSRFVFVISSTVISQGTSIVQVIRALYHRCSFSTSVTSSKQSQHNSGSDLTTYTCSPVFNLTKPSGAPATLNQFFDEVNRDWKGVFTVYSFYQSRNNCTNPDRQARTIDTIELLVSATPISTRLPTSSLSVAFFFAHHSSQHE
ncbi:hypothetical protein J3E68DRAFT_424486 [Trichoderma sp. SZMC 28012]